MRTYSPAIDTARLQLLSRTRQLTYLENALLSTLDKQAGPITAAQLHDLAQAVRHWLADAALADAVEQAKERSSAA
jgi:hypothetical protein